MSEQINSSIPLNFLGDSSNGRPYSLHPAPIRDAIDQIARGLFDTEANHVIVTGSKSSGKSMLIEQFSSNVSTYLKNTNISELKVIRVTPQLQHTITRLPGGISAFMGAVAQHTNLSPDNFCLVTEHPDFAAYVYTESRETKLILEVNYNTYTSMKANEDRGGSKIWGTWTVIDLDQIYLFQDEIETTLNLILARRLSEEHNINISPELIHQFTEEVFKNHSELVFNENDSVRPEWMGRSNGSVGLWGKALRNLATNLAYSYKSEFYDSESGDQIVAKIIEETVRGFASDFSDIMEDEHFAKIANELPPGMQGMMSVMRMGNNMGMPNPNDPAVRGKVQQSIHYTDPDILEEKLHETIFGQDRAISSLTDAMTVVSAGLVDPIKPLRILLFAGPTGVGKTQLALRLSEVVSSEPMNVIRLDMSDYSQPHEVSKLLGAPAGYVGSERGGLLTSKVQANPHSIILLDEVEKAHPQIWDTFLQIFDAGKATDNHGHVVDFTKTIIIMTSNLGAREVRPSEIGYAAAGLSDDVQASVVLRSIKKHFKPELINRIDEIIFFNQLPLDVIRKVVRREIEIVGERMIHKGFTLLDYDDSVMDNIIDLSEFSEYGARDVQRTVFKTISIPIASKMLKETDSKDILLTLSDNKIQIN